MANQPVFGRRANPQRLPRRVRENSAAVVQSAHAVTGSVALEQFSPAHEETEMPPLDRELQEWKRARKQGFRIPWRPLSLMASLCFGVAFFVLPDWVNDLVQWPLFALAAASFYVGISRRRRKAKS